MRRLRRWLRQLAAAPWEVALFRVDRPTAGDLE